jgi:excisionase family DNA binding protein
MQKTPTISEKSCQKHSKPFRAILSNATGSPEPFQAILSNSPISPKNACLSTGMQKQLTIAEQPITTSGQPGRLSYSLKEVAELLGCHKATVYRLIYDGALVPIKGFGRARIATHELMRFVNNGKAMIT